jgi:hypothetical protein
VKSLLRIFALLAVVAVLAAATAPTPVSALSPAEMTVVGGSACSFAEGAGYIFTIAGFFNGGFALAAAAIGAGVMYLC